MKGLFVVSFACLSLFWTSSLLLVVGVVASSDSFLPQPLVASTDSKSSIDYSYYGDKNPESFRDNFRRLLVHALQTSVGVEKVAAAAAAAAASSSNHTALPTQISLHRYLAEGDFDAFNRLFSGAIINLPDASIQEGQLKLNLKGLYCQEISVSDILLSHAMETSQRFTFQVKIVGLALKCYSRYDYGWRFINGSGNIFAESRSSSADTQLAFTSTNFNVHPPSASSVESCVASVQIADLDFSGGFVNSILDTFERSFRSLIAGQVEKVICDELSSLGTTFVDDLLDWAETELETYLQPIPPQLSNPLHLENTFYIPPGTNLLNLQDIGGSLGSFVEDVLARIDSLFGEIVDDPNAPDGTGKDLGVNTLLRRLLLDENRVLFLRITDLPFVAFDPVLFKSHDLVSETVITLTALRVYGLDTFHKFDPLVAIGKYTLENKLHLDFLTVELDLDVVIKPSTKPDSVISTSNPDIEIKESIQVKFGLDDLNITLALLVALSQERIMSLEIGSLLRSENLLPCFASTALQLAIAGLDVSVVGVREPVLEGFVSAGIDRIVTEAVEAVFAMYKAAFFRAVPYLFQGPFRSIIQEEVVESEFLNPSSGSCSWLQQGATFDEYIDFRDLLLAPSDSVALGGSGREPYGDIGHVAYGLVRSQVLEEPGAEEGFLAINDLLIKPLTSRQSGVEGLLRFDSTFASVSLDIDNAGDFGSIISGLNFSIADLRVSSLDSIISPLSILMPTFAANDLWNDISFVPHESEPLRMNILVRLAIGGENSPLAMNDQIDFGISTNAIGLSGALTALIRTSNFLRLPLKHVFNFSCWLHTIARAGDKSLSASHEAIGLALSTTYTYLMNLDLDAICSNCSPGLATLPRMLTIFRSSGAIALLGTRLSDLARTLMEGNAMRSIFENLLSNAPYSCPVSPQYDVNAPVSSLSMNISDLAAADLDTMLYATLLFFEIGFVALVENHRAFPHVPAEALALQGSTDNTKEYLDWTDFGNSIGLGNLGDQLLQLGLKYIQGVDDDGNLRINSLLKSFLLDDADTLSLEFENTPVEIGDLSLGLKYIKINGLTSFTSLRVADALAPQTLFNRFALDSLTVNITAFVNLHSSIDPPQEVSFSFGIDDLDFSVILFAAFDIEKMGNLQLGDVLDTSDILDCVLSTVDKLYVPVINLSSAIVRKPEVVGLLADSSATITNTIDVVWEEFRSNIEEALPVLLDTSIRKVFNTVVKSLLDGAKCPDRARSTGDVDFRAMFSGLSSVYGNLPKIAIEQLETTMLAVESSTGLARLNEVVGSWIEDGTLRMDKFLINTVTRRFRKIGVRLLKFALGKLSVSSLDTVKAPVKVLEPNTTDGSLLNNYVRLGGGPNPLRLSMEAHFETVGDPALETNNDMEVSLEMGDVDIYAVLLARIGLAEFMTFRLKHLLNVNCLLALFYAEDKRDLLVEFLSITVSSFQMHVRCVEGGTCSSGLVEADTLFKVVAESDFGSILGSLVLEVVEELVQGDFFHSFLDGWIADSAQSCPEVTSTIPIERRSQMLSVPHFSLDAMQKIFAFAYFVVEGFGLAIFETHADLTTEWDPMTAQDILTLNETELIDFTNFSTSIGGWTETLLDEIRSYAEGGNNGRPRINDLLETFFLDETGAVAVNLTHVDVSSEAFGLSLKEIRLRYLNSMNNLTLLDMLGPQTIRTVVGMDRVRGELDLSIRIGTQVLPMTIHMELEDVKVAFSILLAINKELLGNIKLSQFLVRKDILRCLFSTMPEVVATELDFTSTRIASFGVDGLGVHSVSLQTITDFILENYGERIAYLMRPFFGNSVRSILNNWFAYMTNDRFGNSCPASVLSIEEGIFVDFRDLLLTEAQAFAFGGGGDSPYGDVFEWVINIVKENLLDIDEETGLSDANGALIRPLTKTQSKEAGKVSFPGDIFATDDVSIQVGGLDAIVNFRFYDFFVKNLDSVGAPLSILEPIEGKAHELSNEAMFGKVKPVQLGFRLFVSLSDPNSEIRNDISVGIDLDSVYVLIDALLKLGKERFLTLPVRHLTDLNCWLWLMPSPLLDSRGIRLDKEALTFALTKLDVALDRVRLNVTCIECSSPGMDDFSKLLATPQAADSATEVANMLLDYMTDLLGGEYLQTRLDLLLNDAERLCPASPLFDASYVSPAYVPFESPPEQESSLRVLILVAISSGIVIFAVLATMICVKCVVRRRHRRWIRSLDCRKVQALLQLQIRENTKETALNDLSRPLFLSPEVPYLVRTTMPIVIVGNIGFFLSGHLSLGATVNIEAVLAEQAFSVTNFFEFSMLRSTLEIWAAGGKELAILIFIFSVIWPYTKQLITLAVWFSSPKLLSISKRGSTLLWLDTLAKWSMVDIMTLIVTIAGFRISIKSPDVGFLPEGFYSLDLLVVPMWGLYANMIAQIISQLSSHAIVHYHRRIEKRAASEYEELYRLNSTENTMVEADDASSLHSREKISGDSDRSARLSEHAFSRPHRGESDKLITRRGTGCILLFVAVTITCLVAMGCILPSFSLEILGMLGVAIESGQRFDQARTEYTVFTIIDLLFEQARFTGRTADFIGLGSLAGLLLLSVLIVPIVQSIVLLYMWFSPMSDRRRRSLNVAVEVLQAWQYAEVYLMSVIVASWQLAPVSDFMINTYCQNLEATFAQMVYYGILKEEDAQCFRVEAHIENASYILAAGSVALALLNTFVMRAVTQYFRDIDLTEKEYKASIDQATLENEDLSQAIRQIKPVPVLFSDAFRWFLTREDFDPSRGVFVSVGDRDRGMDLMVQGISENIPHKYNDLEKTKEVFPSGLHLMADTMDSKNLVPGEAMETRGCDDFENTFYDEDSYYNDHEVKYSTPPPRPRQPEILPLDDNLSSDTVRDSSSNSAGTSLENQTNAGGYTVLSLLSELTEKSQTEPWKDV